MFKNQFFKKLPLVGAGLFLLPLFTAPAHAYIDPGTASIVLQSIIGAIAAGSLFFRTHIAAIWYKIFPGRERASTTTSIGDGPADAG